MKLLLKPFLAVGNAFVRRILQSRFHWLLSRNIALLRVKGRKSDRLYLIPVNYRPTADGISVMTYRRRRWWRNIRSDSDLQIHLRGKLTSVTPEVVVDDLEEIAAGLLDRGWVRKAVAPAKARESVLIKLRLSD